VKNWPQVADHRERAADVLGQRLRDSLAPVAVKDSLLKLHGWVAVPGAARSTSRRIYLYVNGRSVRDRVLQHALFQGYAGRLMKGQFPVAVLFLKVPYDRVDVNVHPTKNEVRFADQRFIHDCIRAAVGAALTQADKSKWGTSNRNRVGHGDQGISERTVDDHRPTIADTRTVWPAPSADALSRQVADRQSKRVSGHSNLDHAPQTADGLATPVQPPHQARLWGRQRFADLKIIGQFSETFLLCEAGQDLIVIDQHAAHERIMYEQLQRRAQRSRPATQGLLVPETIELGFREAQILEAMLPDLERLGLVIEPFGGNTFVVKAVPVLLGQGSVEPLVNEMVEKMAAIGFAPGLEKAFDECLHLMACHGAIRANQSLNQAEIKRLLVQLDACEQPSNCPHGRPTWIKWNRKFFEKAFGRIK
jgi:DNA mismatch repair protein MutL